MRAEDERAMFARVFEPHLGQAYRLARWLSGNATDAQDIVQEAALRAFRAIRECSGANSKAWVLAIVRNTASTWLSRHRGREQAATGGYETDEGDTMPPDGVDDETPEALLVRADQGEAIRRAVAALPPLFQEAIVLREINELSYREIAELTNAPIGTVMSRISRARALLIAELGGEHGHA